MFNKKKQFFFINNGYSSISNIFDKVKIKQLSNKLKKTTKMLKSSIEIAIYIIF